MSALHATGRNKDGKGPWLCWGRWKECEKDFWDIDARECLGCGQYQLNVLGWSDFEKLKEQGHKSEEHAKESAQETIARMRKASGLGANKARHFIIQGRGVT